MKKLIIIMCLLILGGVFSGCAVAKKTGAGVVEGAVDKIGEISANKNRALLDQAVSEGAAIGMTYDEIDTNGDGLLDGKEQTVFQIAKAKHENKQEVMAALEALKNGDVEKAKELAAKAKEGAVSWLQGILGLIAAAAATHKGTMIARDRKYKKKRASDTEPEVDHGTTPGRVVSNLPHTPTIES